jgi:PPK2 family polyphosphate:nucleotide phosphotransferase
MAKDKKKDKKDKRDKKRDKDFAKSQKVDAPKGKGDKRSASEPHPVDDSWVEAEELDNEFPEPLGGFADALRVTKGFVLADVDPSSTPNFEGDKDQGERALAAFEEELGDLIERLHAESTAGGKRSVLLVVQGMDTAGKGGIMRHVVSVNPQNVKATAFRAPTEEEKAHDWLWRIEKALPQHGQLGVFDRSHYEDVLIVRVHDLVSEDVWSQRYTQINAFERQVIRGGTRVIKVMLHISKDEQQARLQERLERPDKYYKFNPGDVDERAYWDDYMEAYQAALTKCSTVGAPWHVVPADNKWYARLAIQQLLLEAMREMDLRWPGADFDVEEQKARLAQS